MYAEASSAMICNGSLAAVRRLRHPRQVASNVPWVVTIGSVDPPYEITFPSPSLTDR